ncbi:MAG: translational GTPase TypA [Myxococcaceae bacterium]|jgi:GTP-binding protein|nr:translational GTPase TypA [Myxococcaceae bacterium]
MFPREKIRNIAIVAHVDHGKTTLVDHMLRQGGAFRSNEQVAERVMDSNDLEKEKGITIMAKNTAIMWKGHQVNIVDTPGHADFGGEVERGLRMVDGVLLLVDAAEGPLPQTRFVLSKALGLGLKTVLVINKIDRKDARAREVLDAVYSLYIDLGAEEKDLEFPVIYAIAREGKASLKLDEPNGDLHPLFDKIVEHISPPPAPETDATTQLLIANLDYDDFVGRIGIGRMSAGRLAPNMPVAVCRDAGKIEQGKIVKLYGFSGLKRVEIADTGPGEIVCIAGIEDLSIGDTITSVENPKPLPRIKVDEPTMMMVFRVNDSPYAGKEGKYVTSRNLRDRLQKESYRNVSIRVEDTDAPDAFKVVARGELQLAVIIETMRREGYELTASNPEPIIKEIDGVKHEPMELLVCDLPETAIGIVTERLGPRRGRMVDMVQLGGGRTRVTYRIPARGLVGFRSEYLTITKGEGLASSQFDGWEPHMGYIPRRSNGAIIADRIGEAIPYALFSIQERGKLFVAPGTQLYEGMIIGEHAHPNDLDVNASREKKLTNIRAAGRDENVILTPPTEMGLEKALEWIGSDELVEVTPKSIRLRKRMLGFNDRYRAERDRKREKEE